MAWSYTIYPELEVIVVTATGIVTPQMMHAGAAMAYQDSRFHPDLRAFFDFSGVTDWQLTTSELLRMAHIRKFSDKSRTAIFVLGRRKILCQYDGVSG